ncbi:MAG: diaminopimelate epimerase [Terriglobales bacterium]
MTPDAAIRFVKAEANGNDFLVVDADAAPVGARPNLARALCDRHLGVGADGVEFVQPIADGFELHLFNANGSEAEISGNGTRCVAAFYAKHGFRQGTLITRAGPRAARIVDGAANFWTIALDMGVPQMEGEFCLSVQHQHIAVTSLSMGNPQCVALVPVFPENWEALGAALESHPHFPQHTNVEFVRVLGRHRLDIRIFERGVGPTHSSGTGSCAAAVVAIASGHADSPVEVLTPGGSQLVHWHGPAPDAGVSLVGPARILAEGVFFNRTL